VTPGAFGAALLALLLIAADAIAQIKVDLELVLAIDVSRSVDEEEAKMQREGYVAAFLSPQIHRAVASGQFGKIAVAYIEWADYYYVREVLPWTVIDGADSAKAFAIRLANEPYVSGFRTSISAGIDAGAKMIRENEYEGTRKVIDVSGDGPNNSGRPAEAARDEAVKQGITINGLVIINDRWTGNFPPPANLDVYYEKSVIGGPDAFMLVAEGFKTFGTAILNKLIKEIADLAEPPSGTRYGLARFAGP